MSLTTFSIVAYSAEEDALGVAVASKFLAAAALVSWAQAGAGAVATQAFAKVGFGPDGLKMMADGMGAEEVLEKLLAADPDRDHRQVGLVDTKGGVAAHTGSDCFDWAGHLIGESFTCQGNILTGGDTLEAMAEAYRNADGELSDKLVAALLAGDTVGGDSRGKQSAGVLVVRPNGGYGGDNDRYMDLRVDDDPEPVKKLQDLLTMHHLYFGSNDPDKMVPIDGKTASDLQKILKDLDFYTGAINGNWDQDTIDAFWAFCGNENLEERWNPEEAPEYIDQRVLDFILERYT